MPHIPPYGLPFGPLLQEYRFPSVVTNCCQLSVVIEIKELFSRPFFFLTGQVRKKVIPVKMNPKLFAVNLMASF